MKLLLNSAFLAILLAFIGFPSLSAQDTIRIAAKGMYTNNQIVLRWAPLDIESWRYSNANGFRLERKTLRSGGQLLPTADFHASLVVLSTSLLILPESQWEALADSSDMAGIAAGSIYGDSLDLLSPEGGGLLQIYNKARELENRFGFSLFAADQDLKVAKAMGLAFVDTAVLAGKEYVYFIKALGAAATEGGFASVETDTVSVVAAPKGLIGLGSDKAATLQWNKDETQFSSFVVERAVGVGGTFVQLNTSPLMFASTTGDPSGPMTYIDSLADNTTVYVYRVRGQTPFGSLSAPSDTVQVTGKPSAMAFLMSIQKIEELNEGDLTITWEFPALLETQMTGFDLYRSDKVDGAFSKLNTDPIGMSLRTFVDANPLPANYYMVKTIDQNGHEYQTFPYLGQPHDDTPPQQPVILTAECSKTGVVTLNWAKNADSDVMGYRVFTSNAAAGDFAQITTTWVNDTIYRYQVASNTLSEEVYFGIKALDFHHNQSIMSEPVLVMRPDVIPPAPPVIKTVEADNFGVFFEWDLSPSTDVVSYTLERKEAGIPEWVAVVNFVDSLYSFKDVTASVRKKYEYRLIALDDAGLKSSSKIIKAKPVDSGVRGLIQNLVGQLFQNPKRVVLQWDYADHPDLIGFEIFRAIQDVNKQRSYDFMKIPPTAPSGAATNSNSAILNGNTWNCTFTDADLNFAVKQLNAFVAFPNPAGVPNNAVQPPVPGGAAVNNFVVLNPNNLAGQPNPIPTRLYYWVMAKYADGGYSPVAGQIMIIFQ